MTFASNHWGSTEEKLLSDDSLCHSLVALSFSNAADGEIFSIVRGLFSCSIGTMIRKDFLRSDFSLECVRFLVS